MALAPLEAWFEEQGWSPFAFQREVWTEYLAGRSGLIHSATGTGKTLAAWLGPLAEWLEENGPSGPLRRAESPPLRVLWITPLRALAADTAASLAAPLPALGVPWSLELRTGDTSSSVRGKQAVRLPTALVTTPESLCIMLASPDAESRFADLRLIVCDEWHELMGSKRGVQTELALARLRAMRPQVRTWGVSATLGNLEEARDTLLAGQDGMIVHGVQGEPPIIDSLLPERMERFPWSGHMGMQMVGPVIGAIEEGRTCLVFTNTRAHSELWYQEILARRPDWEGVVALHHGSLARETRDEVESGLKAGLLRAVVCTSSLDLGVDFPPVDRVVQIGSPKGVGRLLQRAGRSGHRPGIASRVSCVPTHAFELVEVAAAREAAEAGHLEPREGLRRPLDVLAQHLVTVACGSGFRDDPMREEVERTHAYRGLSDAEWQWTLDFVTRGGESLRAYPEYRRVTLCEDGVYRVDSDEIARRHRMSVGTIVADATIAVQTMNRAKLGSIEESFLSRLKPGDRFLFAGRSLEFVRVKDMTAWVRIAKSGVGGVPRWSGARMPLTGALSQSMRGILAQAKHGVLDSPEMRALGPILDIQSRWSAIPDEDELLVEHVRDREGHHLFVYPFEGRLVNEGLAALIAHRLSRRTPITFTFSMNDYGFELLSAERAPLDEALMDGLFDTGNVTHDVQEALNSGEMAKRQFREIARVAGLIFPGFPGMGKNAKQLQASSGLFYDVFARYDPENLLLRQARQEVLERQLEESRLVSALYRLGASRVVQTSPRRATPLAFPLLVDRWRETVSSESLSDRVARMTLQLEAEADDPTAS